MYSILEYISSGLLLILLLPYIFRIANKKILGNKPQVRSAIGKLKKIHRTAGILLAMVAVFHGYLALGTLRLHTGSILYALLLIAMTFGTLFGAKKKKQFLVLHKTFVGLAIAMWAVHILFPSAIYYLMK